MAIVGKYRSGKSYFINKLIEKSNVFEVGSTVNACTKGIWLYKNILTVEGKNILLLDTEGMGAMDVNKKSDSSLF